MIVEIVPIQNLRYEKVTYYTARVEGRDASEFRDFQQRMSANTNDQIELNEIRRYIQKIGNEWGAEPVHFKDERAAERLPPPYYHFIDSDDPNDYGLRLYCIRLTKEIVILLNGGRKTDRNPERCKNCSQHFKFANRLAEKINEAITEKFIYLNSDTREIEIDEDFDLEL